MNSFEGFTIEDLTCPGDEVYGGIQTRLYFAPASFFKTIYLEKGSLEIYPDDLVFQDSGCTWGVVDVLIDQNEIKAALSGGAQRKKTKTSLDLFILGLRVKVLEFTENLKNEPMVFHIPLLDGTGLLLGNLSNRAFFETANSTSAKTYEDNSGSSISITANAPLYFIKNENSEFKIFDQSFDLTFE